MSISACPKCGSRKIFQGRLKEGVLTGYTTKYVCRKCGYQGFPLIFDNEEEYRKFIDQLKENATKDTKEFVPKEIEKSKKPIFLKNITTKLGLSLLVAGILISVATGSIFFFLTGLLILDGVILFIAGVIGPGEEEIKNKLDNFKKYPKYAGVLLIVSGFIFLIFYSLLLFLFTNLENLPLDEQTNYLGVQGYMVNVIILQIVFCLSSIIGGIFSILKKKWEIVLLGAILGSLILVPFYISTIASIIALILISFSRELFNSKNNA